MFFSQPIDWKQEVVVNLLGDQSYGRGAFVERQYGLNHSEVWEVRQRIAEALEPRPSGHPRHPAEADSTQVCIGCQEKVARIEAILEQHAAERERGRQRLTLQAAVLPCSVPSIVLLQTAAFEDSPGRETLRAQIQDASRRAKEILDSLPWAEKIENLTADELFAGKTPILNCVEPRSMAVPALQWGPDRTAKTWQEVLSRFPNLQTVASDQGNGILGAVEALGLLSQGDPFHSFEELSRCLRTLEREAYRRIQEEYDAQKDLNRRKERHRPWKRARQRYQKACKTAAKATDRYDRATEAKPLLKGAIALFDSQGMWLSYEKSTEMIRGGLAILQKIEAPYRKKVARAFNPERMLNFKAVLEAHLEFAEDLCTPLTLEEMIEVVAATMAPCPSEPLAAVHWGILQTLDRNLAKEFPSWPAHRAIIIDTLELPFRSSSWVESINSRLRVDQQVLKKMRGILPLWTLAHNASPFRWGKRKGKSPFEILGMPVPPGSWLDWVTAPK